MDKDLLKQVWEAIDPLHLRQTLMDMVDIYSPSGKEEDIQLYMVMLIPFRRGTSTIIMLKKAGELFAGLVPRT